MPGPHARGHAARSPWRPEPQAHMRGDTGPGHPGGRSPEAGFCHLPIRLQDSSLVTKHQGGHGAPTWPPGHFPSVSHLPQRKLLSPRGRPRTAPQTHSPPGTGQCRPSEGMSPPQTLPLDVAAFHCLSVSPPYSLSFPPDAVPRALHRAPRLIVLAQ